MTASDRGLGDGASPVRDDRTWTICRDVMAGRTGHWRVAQDSANAASLSEPFREAVDVRPASELARVQDEFDQAREALKEIVREARAGTQVGAVILIHEIARAALAASGVTEKEDGTDG